MRSVLFFAIILPFAVTPVTAQDAPAPNAVPFRTVQGRGVQIYTCTASAWKSAGPEADLYDGSVKVGTHAAGPVWTWRDGSSIRGTLLSSTPSPQSGANIPWLVLRPSPNGDKPGELAGTTFVRRTDTAGGVAPIAGCDAAKDGMITRVPYTATYSFYR